MMTLGIRLWNACTLFDARSSASAHPVNRSTAPIVRKIYICLCGISRVGLPPTDTPDITKAAGMKRRFCSLALALLFAAVALWTSAFGIEDSWARKDLPSSSLNHGILLVVAPRTASARDALLPITVSVQNLTGQTVQVTEDSCSIQNPRVEILSHFGRTVYPPALHLSFGSPCRLSGTRPLGVGQKLVRHEYVIVRSSWLRARTDIEIMGKWFKLASAPTRITLRSRTVMPTLLLDSKSNPTQVTVMPPTGAVGRIWYQSQMRCSGGREVSNLSWIPARNSRILADCSRVLEWHLVVGAVDYSVAKLDFVRS